MFETSVAKNGVEVWTISNDSSFIYMGAVLLAGDRSDPYAHGGVARLVQLITQDELEIQDLTLAEFGKKHSFEVWGDTIGAESRHIALTGLKGSAEHMLEYVAALLRRKIKPYQMHETRMKEQKIIVDLPEFSLYKQLVDGILFGLQDFRANRPCRDSVLRISEKQVKDFLKEQYILPNLIIVSVGCLTHEELVHFVEEKFAKKPGEGKKIRPELSFPGNISGKKKFKKEDVLPLIERILDKQMERRYRLMEVDALSVGEMNLLEILRRGIRVRRYRDCLVIEEYSQFPKDYRYLSVAESLEEIGNEAFEKIRLDCLLDLSAGDVRSGTRAFLSSVMIDITLQGQVQSITDIVESIEGVSFERMMDIANTLFGEDVSMTLNLV